LAGAAVVVLAGNVACKPVPIDIGDTVGYYMPLDIAWIDSEGDIVLWDNFDRQDWE
jgi:hypothetical protein